MKLAEASTDVSCHMVFHRQIGLKHDAKVTSNSHRANQGTRDTELPGVEMGTPSAGRAPRKLRLLRIKTESIRSHPLRDLLNSQLPQSTNSVKRLDCPPEPLSSAGLAFCFTERTTVIFDVLQLNEKEKVQSFLSKDPEE